MVLAAIFNYYCTVLAPILSRRWPKRFFRIAGVDFLPWLALKAMHVDLAPAEAATLRYIRQHTTIPVPRVYVSAEDHKYRYFLMERIEGECLLVAWDNMDEQQRDAIVAELKGYLAQLRSLPSPYGQAVCAVDGGGLRDTRVTCGSRIGPFADETTFNDFIVDFARLFVDPYELGKIRPRMRNDHRICFTHGDLAPRNIIVKNGRISGIVDWGESGWYPEHWECVKTMWFPELGESWVRRVRTLFSEDDEKDWLLDQEMSKHFVGAF